MLVVADDTAADAVGYVSNEPQATTESVMIAVALGLAAVMEGKEAQPEGFVFGPLSGIDVGLQTQGMTLAETAGPELPTHSTFCSVVGVPSRLLLGVDHCHGDNEGCYSQKIDAARPRYRSVVADFSWCGYPRGKITSHSVVPYRWAAQNCSIKKEDRGHNRLSKGHMRTWYAWDRLGSPLGPPGSMGLCPSQGLGLACSTCEGRSPRPLGSP